MTNTKWLRVKRKYSVARIIRYIFYVFAARQI